MPTYIIYNTNQDGGLRSSNNNATTARNGSNLVVFGTGSDHLGFSNAIGMETADPPNSTYQIRSTFVRWNTSVVPTSEVITGVEQTYYYFNQTTPNNRTIYVRTKIYNWGSSLTTGNWRTPAQFAALTQVASDTRTAGQTGGFATSSWSSANFSQINKSGHTNVILQTSRFESGSTPTGAEATGITMQGQSSNNFKPRLVVETVAVPTTPTGFTITGTTSSSVSMSWNSVSGADNYRIYRSDGHTWTTTLTSTTNTVNVSSGTSYSYRVRAQNVAGNSAYTAYIPATTIPGIPTGLTWTGSTTNSISFSWNATTGATYYRRAYRPVGGNTRVWGDIGNVTSYQQTGLNPGTHYEAQVRAGNTSGLGDYTAYVDMWTLCATPTGLAAQDVSTNSLTLSWTPTTGAQSYEVERNGTVVDTVTGTSIAEEGLSPNTSYAYRVRAINPAGNSAWSSTVNVTTSNKHKSGVRWSNFGGTSTTPRLSLTTEFAIVSVSTLTDDFNTLDASKWPSSSNATIVSGRLRLFTHLISGHVESAPRYKFAPDSRLAVELLSAGSVADFGAWLGGLSLSVTVNDEQIYFKQNGIQLTSIAYDASAHRWLSLREDSGLIHYEVSATGTSWNTIITTTTPAWATDGGFLVLLEGVGGAEFDNLNLLPAPPTQDPTLGSVILPDIPSFTIPKPVWVFGVEDLVGNNDGDVHSAAGRQVRFARKGHSEASFTLSSRSEDSRLIDELRSDLLIRRNGDFLFRGRIGPTNEAGNADAQSLAVSALDYRALLDRRTTSADGDNTDDQEEVLWGLINTYADDLGITRATNPSGVSITAEWDVGKSLKSIFDDLADTDDSFDWTIDQQLQFRFWEGSRGSDNDFILDYGGTVVSFSRQFDPSGFANAIRVTGDGDETTPVTLSDIGPEGRFAAEYNFPDITNQAHLAAKANEIFERVKVRKFRYTVQLASGVWEPNNLWLGDLATLLIRTERLDINEKMRVEEVAVSIGDDGDETVTITLSEE